MLKARRMRTVLIFVIRDSVLGLHKSRAALGKIIKVIKEAVVLHGCSSFVNFCILPIFRFVKGFLKKFLLILIFSSADGETWLYRGFLTALITLLIRALDGRGANTINGHPDITKCAVAKRFFGNISKNEHRKHIINA